ncbi:MAG: hypothetical protein GY928_03095 [Colwellia sp.]|nr:hypothetical protein [Colwellia sp.]
MEITDIVKLNHWYFDPLKKTLTDDENNITETLEAKHASLLVFLIQKQGEIVSRDELITHVWNKRFIDDRTINATISRLRKILSGAKDGFIKTHRKTGYSLTCTIEFHERIAPEKKITHKKQSKKLKVYKTYSMILTALFFGILWLSLLQLEKPIKILTEVDVKVEPLTYQEGWESNPSMSKGGQYLAFSFLKNSQSKPSVIIQNSNTKNQIRVEPELETTIGGWSMSSNTYYYQASRPDSNECLIKSIFINNDFTIGTIKTIAKCGKYIKSNGLAISSDEQWIYYTDAETDFSTNYIKRLNLITLKSEILTAPPENFFGDIRFCLSPNNQLLAFTRYNDNYESSIMLLNLDTFELTSLGKKNIKRLTLTWQNNDTLYYITKNNKINTLSINDMSVKTIFQASDSIGTPNFINEKNILLTYGRRHKSDIQSLNLSSLKTSSIVESTSNDTGAAIYQKDKVAFVSDRSGVNQIWLKNLTNNNYKQLTFFEESLSITNLSFSINGQSLLFLFNKKLHIIDLTSGSAQAISHSLENIKNPIWACNSNSEVLLLSLIDSTWMLYQVNLTTKKEKILSIDITSLNSYCKNNEYFATSGSMKGIYPVNSDWTLDFENGFFTEQDFIYKNSWAFNKHHIFSWLQYKIISQNRKSGIKSELELQGYTPFKIANYHNQLVFENNKSSDTSIVKVTMP